jgi:hypothetical protein
LQYDECWNQEKLEDVSQSRSRVALTIGLDKFFEKFSKGYKHFDDFKVFFTFVKQPPQSKEWMSDDVFGTFLNVVLLTKRSAKTSRIEPNRS